LGERTSQELGTELGRRKKRLETLSGDGNGADRRGKREAEKRQKSKKGGSRWKSSVGSAQKETRLF